MGCRGRHPLQIIANSANIISGGSKPPPYLDCANIEQTVLFMPVAHLIRRKATPSPQGEGEMSLKTRHLTVNPSVTS